MKAIKKGRMIMIITVSRQYGSGGTELAKEIAKRLDIPFYDKSIIDMTAKESGFDPEFIKRTETSVTSSLLYNLAVGSIYAQPLTDQLYAAECKVVRNVAAKGDGVIVGRCADYILRDEPNVLKIFVHSTTEDRVKRVCERKGVSENEAKELMKKNDKNRSKHYKYYTDRTWGAGQNYDLCINMAVCGVEKAADIIVSLIKK